MRDPRFKVMQKGEELSLVTRPSDRQLLFLANIASQMGHKPKFGSRLAKVPSPEINIGPHGIDNRHYSLFPKTAKERSPRTRSSPADALHCYRICNDRYPRVARRIAQALSANGDLSRHALEVLAVDAYRQKALTQAQVGGLLGLAHNETEMFLARHVDLYDYSTPELEAESDLLHRLTS